MNEAVRVSSFGGKEKILSIDEETIRFQEKKIPRQEITGIKYWVSAIEFYRFPVGRQYHIGLKTPSDQLNITLKSYFGIGNGYFHRLCNRIIEEIWDPVTDRIWDKAIAVLRAGEAWQVDNCQVSKDGILITRNQVITKKQILISWPDLHYEKKYDRLVLNSKKDPRVWANLYFHDSWNVDLLMALLDWLTREGGLAELQS
jgi:hypothetical protein